MSQYICVHRLVLEMHCLLCTFPATQSSLLWPAHWREKEKPHQHTCAQKWHSGNDALKVQGVSQRASWVAEIPEGHNTLRKGHNYHTDCTRNSNYNWHTHMYFAVILLHLVVCCLPNTSLLTDIWNRCGAGRRCCSITDFPHPGDSPGERFSWCTEVLQELVQYCPLTTVNAASKTISPCLLISFLWSCITKARMVKTTNKQPMLENGCAYNIIIL